MQPGEVGRGARSRQARGQRRGARGGADDLHVRPRPRLGRGRQLGGRHADHHRAARPARWALGGGGGRYDDEPQPRRQVAGCIRSGRGELPRQVGGVELDVGQVAGLGVGDAGLGVAPDDLARVDGQDVAGPAQLQSVVVATPSSRPDVTGTVSGSVARAGLAGVNGVRSPAAAPVRKCGRNV